MEKVGMKVVTIKSSDRENNRNIRRDKKRRQKNAPVLSGLPKGFPAGYWLDRKNKEEGGTK